ncbi:hypothetical protein WA026_019180 [Henosepilachna vigintioctopunctata]|uniref:Uncharacterized protein n=1 Tax=Henosepilachna vigintioctopunctata TaxID=420089 RepID=A0AAW1V483_9CUCU
MSKLTLLFVAVSALLIEGECALLGTQEQNLGQSRVSILLELSIQAAELQGKTGLIWLEETLKISGKRKFIKTLQSQAENTLDSELTNLDNQVGQTIAKASKSGKDISKCMADEQTDRWTKVDAKILSQCQTSLSYTFVQLKLTQLIGIPPRTGAIVPKCTLFHPFNNNNFKKCIQDELNKLNTELDTIKKNIGDELDNITNKAKSCIQDKLQSLKQEIKNIHGDFDKCVKNAKKIRLLN